MSIIIISISINTTWCSILSLSKPRLNMAERIKEPRITWWEECFWWGCQGVRIPCNYDHVLLALMTLIAVLMMLTGKGWRATVSPQAKKAFSRLLVTNLLAFANIFFCKIERFVGFEDQFSKLFVTYYPEDLPTYLCKKSAKDLSSHLSVFSNFGLYVVSKSCTKKRVASLALLGKPCRQAFTAPPPSIQAMLK